MNGKASGTARRVVRAVGTALLMAPLAAGCTPIQMPEETTTPSVVGFIENRDVATSIYTITLASGKIVEIDVSEAREFLTTSLPLDAGYLLLYGQDEQGPWYLALSHLQCGSNFEIGGPALERRGSIIFTSGLELTKSDGFDSSEDGQYGVGYFCIQQDGTVATWTDSGA